MTNTSITFDIREESEVPPGRYKETTLYMIFDVKLDSGSTWKAILVAYDHNIEKPPSMTHALVVSREIVRIALMLESLNSINVKSANAQMHI